MVSRSLVRHWIGMSKEDIIAGWRADRRHEGERFDHIIQEQKEQLVLTIVENIEASAKKGDIDAFEWLEARRLISEDGRRSDMFVMMEAIANRARDGEMDAVKWLEGRGLIDLSGIPDATE